MKYVVAAHSDTGTRKQINQDSLCVKVADTKRGQIVMGIICDGMGGLAKGELASATVVREFSSWFETELPKMIDDRDFFAHVKTRWNNLVETVNRKILEYGKLNDISLGTTIAAIIINEGHYLIVNIGDSRVYRISNFIEQLTTDQTLIQKEIDANAITEEQAEHDSRKGILTQCIGGSRVLEPEFLEGQVRIREEFLVCSDGFRNKLNKEEIQGVLSPFVIDSVEVMRKGIIDLVELAKQRGEKDNISALMIRIV